MIARTAALAFAALVQAGACTAQTTDEPGAGSGDPRQTCHADKAQWTLYSPGTDELLEKARVDSGAKTARFLKQNEPVTQEFMYGRLNLTLDVNGIVVNASCW